MPGPVKQMQMLYSPEEDRILFRVNSMDNSEFRFWLTRRFTSMLTRVLAQHVELDLDVSTQESPEARQAVKQFKHEQAVQNADFAQPFEDQQVNYPLGQDSILAYRLTGKRNGLDLQLGIHPKTGQGITVLVNHALNASITELLSRCIRQAQWDMQSTKSADKKAAKMIVN
jgi:hypothetical protein